MFNLVLFILVLAIIAFLLYLRQTKHFRAWRYFRPKLKYISFATLLIIDVPVIKDFFAVIHGLAGLNKFTWSAGYMTAILLLLCSAYNVLVVYSLYVIIKLSKK